jgi:hypothetical protein
MKTKILLVAAAALVLGLPAAARAAPVSFNDPGGDNAAAADIGAVTVDSAADGFISLKASIANLPQIGQPGFAIVVFDTDRNGATGSLMGGDYVFFFEFSAAGWGMRRWNGTEYVDAGGDSVATIGAGSLEVKVGPASLGGAKAFNFVIVAGSGEVETAEIDAAPDSGTWFYEVKAPVVTVDTIVAKFVPAAPKAGAVFQAPLVRMKLSDGRTVLASKYRCVAQLAGKLLRGTGKGSCSFRIPKNAKGKRLRVTLFVTYNGVTDEFDAYVFKVR